MMKRLFASALLLTALTCTNAGAAEPRPDDRVTLSLAAESWVNTKTANVTVSVEAAMSGAQAGAMRGSMLKAVTDLAKGDWRLTGMNRSQDQTGMERWSALFEARLPEADLNGLSDKAKKASKPGMQLTVQTIDFTPTLEEMQAAQSQLRTQIYKMAAEQLASLNSTLAGRSYRISAIEFQSEAMPVPRMAMHAKNARLMTMAMGASVEADAAASAPMEKAEKLTLIAQIVFAAEPPAGK